MSQLFKLLLLVSFINPVNAQQNQVSVLYKKISLRAEDETVRTILKKIEKQAGTSFSYDSKIIDSKKKKTVSFDGKTIPEIIDVLFENKVGCKIKGSYILLYKQVPVRYTYEKKNQTIKRTPADSRHYLKPSNTRNDTIVRYFIDVITTNSEGKDSVIQTESIFVPASQILKIQDDSTIIMLEKNAIMPK